MEKKLKKNSQNPKTPSKSSKTNFTTSGLQISDVGASCLVGSIVEKGISDEPRANPVPPPKPTVLPFPVARHRSHGLHWAPSGSKGDTVDSGDNGLSEDDRGFMEYDSIAHLANPVERNNRKGMELSNWKELLSGNNDSFMAEKLERSSARPGIVKNWKNVGESIERARKNEGKSVSVDVKELDYSENIDTVDHVHELKRREIHYSNSGVVASEIDKNNEQEDTSLESQIDAENRARLQGMSPEEIAEAQAEILERLNPSLLKLLKKKGEERMKLKSSGMDISNDVKPIQKSEDIIEAPALSASGISTADRETSTTSNNTQSGLDNGERRNPKPSGGSLWSTWSDRVEGARGLRFTLDGTIVEGFSDHIADANCVAERDFLRTEGDPGAAGYTIKEAVALTRSVIPGQRALALHILCSALENAVQNICRGQVGFTMRKEDYVSKFTDWEAVWAYALGPEPELVLSLRMCLDDNHNSVVLACAKVIQCILTCDGNENFFNVSEKATLKDICSAPVFRSKPEVDVAFLRGGFWKYNAKSSNILKLDEDIDDETDDKHTIQDDIVVGGQDFAAGLVRMGIIPRLRYLLESDLSVALEECVVSILIAITRHSPTCANAVMNCQRLIEIVVKRFTSKESTQNNTSMIKAVSLIKVLAQSDSKNCVEFMKNGTFLIMTRNLFKHPSSLDQWVKSGKENCKLNSALTIEQLRLWKVCILHGYCVSYFSDIFPSMCLWLNPPSLEKLNESSFLCEYSTISAESYLVLEALARTLPNFFSQMHPNNQIGDMEAWSWSQVSPMVDSAVKWIDLMSDLNAREFWRGGIMSGNAVQDQSRASLLWVYSSVMGMLVEVLRRVIPDDTITCTEGDSLVPWLPEFVPKIGLAMIRNRFLNFSDDIGTKFATDLIADGSFVENLCYFRLQNEGEASLASICCLQRLTQSVVSIDKLIQSAKKGIQSSQEYSLSHEEKILSNGILKGFLIELSNVQSTFMKLAASEWKLVQSIEVFGRGGPAPGVGIGWGASGGGYWSATVLLAEADAGLTIDLFETFQALSVHDVPNDEEIPSAAKIINASLAACLISGPREDRIIDKAFKFLANVSVLKYLDLSTRKFILHNKIVGHFEWEYKEKDFQLFSKILTSHFNGRWLSVKKRKTETADDTIKKNKGSLGTIYEDSDTSSTLQVTSSTVEWAHQRLPLPVTWFLSPISTLCHSKQAGLQKCSNLENLMQDPGDWLEIASAGLFFLLGIESISNFLPADIPSTVRSVPLVWKLHSLSVILLVGMNVIEENKSRDVYKALQNLYGEVLDKARRRNAETSCEHGNKNDLELLSFQSDVHDSYSTFIETLVEQFSAISYGDLIYGCQVALYLHRCVEAPVRLAAWNALSNACVLELLPNLESCVGEAEGYLQPIEDKDEILEAYVKSWTSGALDRAANRGSIAYTLVLHHLSHFIFHSVDNDDEKLLLRNKLARLLLRDFSLKQHHEVMMLNLLRYDEKARSSSLYGSNVEKKLEVLVEASERNPSLLMEVNKLKSLVQNSL